MSIVKATKAAKAIALSAQAHEGHNSVKLKNVLRWLKSGHEIRVQITGKSDRQKAIEGIYDQLEKEARSGARFLQKVIKPGSIKVTLMPTEEAANIKISEARIAPSAEEEIESMTSDRDVFSEDFEKDLLKSIREDRAKNKRK